MPQPGLDIGNPGAPVVNGSGQAGLALMLRGFAAGYVVREGQFFSIIHGGRRYLHCAESDATANFSGGLILGLYPMLRIKPLDGAVCEFAKPYIEGIVAGSSVDLELTSMKAVLPPILITERA